VVVTGTFISGKPIYINLGKLLLPATAETRIDEILKGLATKERPLCPGQKCSTLQPSPS